MFKKRTALCCSDHIIIYYLRASSPDVAAFRDAASADALAVLVGVLVAVVVADICPDIADAAVVSVGAFLPFAHSTHDAAVLDGAARAVAPVAVDNQDGCNNHAPRIS